MSLDQAKTLIAKSIAQIILKIDCNNAHKNKQVQTTMMLVNLQCLVPITAKT